MSSELGGVIVAAAPPSGNGLFRARARRGFFNGLWPQKWTSPWPERPPQCAGISILYGWWIRLTHPGMISPDKKVFGLAEPNKSLEEKHL